MSTQEIPGSGYAPTREDYGTGAYRRRIRVRSAEGALHADMEDDFHRFALRVEHDGERVTAVHGAARRAPWTTCPAAVDELERLVGVRLTESHAEVREYSDPRTHCTHLFDLATVAITCAARGAPGADYRVEIPDAADGRRKVRLERDGSSALEWHIEEARIVAPTPAPYAGMGLRGGFGRWAEATLEPAVAEAAQVLRRAVFIAVGRRFDLDQIESATALGTAPSTCHSFSPDVWQQADRAHGTVRDFSERPDALLAEPLRP